MALHPDWATHFGVHRYDDRLPDVTASAREAESELLRRLTTRLNALVAGDSEQALERDLAHHLVALRRYHLEHLRFWARVSDAADVLGSALFPLFTRDFAPPEQRYAAMAARLRRAPQLLEESRHSVTQPVQRWNETALESCQATPEFIDAILAQGRRSVPAPRLVTELEQSAVTAKAALEEHARWLKTHAIPRGDAEYRIGREDFEELLRRRELPYTAGEILEIGRQGLADTRAERLRLAAQIRPDAPVETVAAAIRAQAPPDFGTALDAYRDAIAECRAFVVDQGLATMPAGEELVVMETPRFLRPVLPFAAYFTPAKFDAVRRGVYVVTPPDGAPAGLGEHNYAAILNTSVHEGYPGHHLQLSCAATHPSLIRLLTDATEFVEGWAFYCEQLMLDQGFHDTLPRRFVQVTDLIWRAARILCDVGLSCRTMTFEEAVELLVRETQMDRKAAAAEVARYIQNPGQPLSYFLGKQLIGELRKKAEHRGGAAFDLKAFHDRLLYAGSLPIPYLRRLVLQSPLQPP